MTEKQGRAAEKRRREAEMYRVDAIQLEMASAVRLLGGEGSAKEQINRAAHATKLPHSVIARLRWKKNKRPFADIVDAVREAVTRHNEESLNRAKHELFVAQKLNEAMAARLLEIDPDFYGPEITRLRRPFVGSRRGDDLQSGE